MPAVNPGEIWMTDFGMAAKVRPALFTRTVSDQQFIFVVTFVQENGLWEIRDF